MAHTLLISVFCPDRIGLVSAVTASLFDLGGDLGDTSFAVLGAGAEFTTVCDLPEGVTAEEVEQALAGLPALGETAEIRVRPFRLSPRHDASAEITHRIELTGEDRPGVLARVSEVFQQFGSNIVRLDSDRWPGVERESYRVRILAWIPPERSAACLAALGNTASEMRLDFHVAEAGGRAGAGPGN